jgi:hypothetical protein
MQAGDWVKCRNHYGIEDQLTNGKLYKVKRTVLIGQDKRIILERLDTNIDPAFFRFYSNRFEVAAIFNYNRVTCRLP